MAFQVIVRNRATQDIRQQANYILVNGNRELGEKFLEFAECAFAQLAIREQFVSGGLRILRTI